MYSQAKLTDENSLLSFTGKNSTKYCFTVSSF